MRSTFLTPIVHVSAAALCTLFGAAAAWADPPPGACCQTSASGAGTCSVVRHNTCNQSGGQFQGNNTACGPNNSCPTGACCLTSELGVVSCAVRTRTACQQSDGHFKGINNACTAERCPPLPTGACCVAGGGGTVSCSIQNAVWCQHFFGAYQGNNIPCGPNGACTPRGACCDALGFCEVKLQPRCTGDRTFGGDRTVCFPNPCPQPIRGACCVTVSGQAYCLVVRSVGCTDLHGTYQGDNTACTASTCPQPVLGACCIAATSDRGARCASLTRATCDARSGTYSGDHTACATANCPRACACDWDRNGFLTAHDAAAFLTDWLAGHGDFNHDGATNQQDLTDFGNCYNTAPTGCFRP